MAYWVLFTDPSSVDYADTAPKRDQFYPKSPHYSQ